MGQQLSMLPQNEALMGFCICPMMFIMFLFLSIRPFLSFVLAGLLLVLMVTINYYVFKFRSAEFSPMDILAAGTAISVIDGYDLTPEPQLIIVWLSFLSFLFAVSGLHLKKLPRVHCMLISATIIIFLYAWVGTGIKNVGTSYYSNGGTIYHGYFLNFYNQLRQISSQKPENYDALEL